MSWYRHKLERDLARWQAAGWVTPGGAGAIRNDLAQRKSLISAAPVLAILGAVLFGFAAMSFVAAHWTAVLKENSNGQKWAVDSWIYANGENPAIVEAEKWYISSLDQLPKSTR